MGWLRASWSCREAQTSLCGCIRVPNSKPLCTSAFQASRCIVFITIWQSKSKSCGTLKFEVLRKSIALDLEELQRMCGNFIFNLPQRGCTNFGGKNRSLRKSDQESWMWPWLVWLGWLGIVLQTEKLRVQFSVRSHDWVSGLVPSQDTYKRQLISVSLSRWCFSSSLPLSLKSIKKTKRKLNLRWWSSHRGNNLTIRCFPTSDAMRY